MKKRDHILFNILSVILIWSIGLSSFAQNTKEQENKRSRLEKEIQVIDAQLKDNAKQSSSALTTLNLLQAQIKNRRSLLEESDRQIRVINSNILSREREIQAIQSRLDTLSAYYAKLVRSAYKNRDTRVWYMYILSSENLGQAFRRVGYLRTLSLRMNNQAEKIKSTKAELEAEKERLEVLKAEAEELRAQREEEVKNLQKEEEQANEVVKDLNRQKTKYQKDLEQKRKQVEALNREIEKIIREAREEAAREAARRAAAEAAAKKKAEEEAAKKAAEANAASGTATSSSSSSGTSTSSGTSSSSSSTTSRPKTEPNAELGASFASNQGKLPWPVDGPIVDHFGQRNHPVYTNVKLPDSKGISIAVAPGTQVKAVFEGVVRKIMIAPGYNQCILIEHGGYYSFYCKLKTTAVKAGDQVKMGQVIGTVDTIDNETQLHFQIWKETTPQNPERWLRP